MKAPFEVEGYFRRWYMIPRNRFFNIYLHHFFGADPTEQLHDHPWWSISILLKGGYVENQLPHDSDVVNVETFNAPTMTIRKPEDAHQLKLLMHNKSCWTIFITFNRVREWGFYSKDGWVRWDRAIVHPDPDVLPEGTNDCDNCGWGALADITTMNQKEHVLMQCLNCRHTQLGAKLS
jgi:hypothetical protein